MVSADEVVWPKHYDQMNPPFPHDSVRILVVPLDSCPPLAAMAAAAAARVAALLPEGVKVCGRPWGDVGISACHMMGRYPLGHVILLLIA